jgi:hypothetical protein
VIALLGKGPNSRLQNLPPPLRLDLRALWHSPVSLGDGADRGQAHAADSPRAAGSPRRSVSLSSISG